MVGVPGRSKSCSTCRRRRKGCDLQRPKCTQCRLAGFECGGYEKDLIFVVNTLHDRPTGRSYCLSRDNPRAGSGIVQPDSLTWSAYESRYTGLFWEAYLPRGRPIPSQLAKSYICNWTDIAQRLYVHDDSLRFALLANCLCIAGVRGGEPWMEVEGRRMYCRALSSLKLSLRGGGKDGAMVIAAKLLSIFEMFFGSDRRGFLDSQSWEQHNAGETALLVARGPEGCVGGDGHQMFIDDRVDLLLSAIKARKRSVLSTAAWMTTPWSETPKNLKDVLVDVLIHMPGLLEELDCMRLCPYPAQKASQRQRLVDQCGIFEAKLDTWRAIVCPEGRLDDCFLDRHRGTQEDIAIVHGLTLFWTASILLYTTLRLASGPEASLPAHADARIYIRNVVMAAPLMLGPKAGLYGQHAIILPLAVALQYSLAIGPGWMGEWHERIAGVLGGPSGGPIRAFLIGCETASPRPRDWAAMGERARKWAGFP